jgi:hypothetical protein
VPALTDSQKLLIGYGLGTAFFLVCVGVSILAGDFVSLDLLLCLLGGTAGWTTGILATPLDEDERTTFTELAKGFLALGSGYAIGKLESPLVDAITVMVKTNGDTLSLRVSLFATCFFVGLLSTLVTRLYGESESKRKERRLARLLAQEKEITCKIAAAREA